MNYAEFLIDQLVQQGVSHFCIAPGARSAPLALAAARHPKATLAVHFDERGLAFYAMGFSSVRNTPAAVIVTSGTAVGNLLPAVMEAAHSHIPLILLTADRPPELRDCCANQTTDQIKLFDPFSVWECDLPCDASESFVRAQASYACFQALSKKGPVHLNCPLRDPLYTPFVPWTHGTAQTFEMPRLSWDQTEEIPEMRYAKRGVLLIGRMPFGTSLLPCFHFAQQLGWPIFADLLSSSRAYPPPYELIDHFDLLVKQKDVPLPEQIIHIGERLTSKAILQWIQNNHIPVTQVSIYPERIEPLEAKRIWCDPLSFCKQAIRPKNRDFSWLTTWKELDTAIHTHQDALFSQEHPLTEPDMMRLIGKTAPEGWCFFLANSMPIRDAEHFLFPKKPAGFFANRGLAGIDGQIATAVGIAESIKKPLCAIIGDQSALHDLNSLPLLHRLKHPFLLIFSNNFGGGIFSHLPFAQDSSHFEMLFGNPHAFSFEHVANMFSIPYRRCKTASELGELFHTPKLGIVEVITSRKENQTFRTHLQQTSSSAVSSVSIAAT